MNKRRRYLAKRRRLHARRWRELSESYRSSLALDEALRDWRDRTEREMLDILDRHAETQ